MKSTDIFICCSCIAVFLFCHTFIITVLINNAFKIVQQSAKNKEDICRRSGLRQVFLMSQMEIQASYVVQLFAV